MHSEVDRTIGTVVDAHLVRFLDAAAHERDEVPVMLEGVDHREDLFGPVHLVGAVSYLCGTYSSPCLMAADAVDHELRDGIEREFAWLRDKDIGAVHEDIGTVYG